MGFYLSPEIPKSIFYRRHT